MVTAGSYDDTILRNLRVLANLYVRLSLAYLIFLVTCLSPSCIKGNKDWHDDFMQVGLSG